MKDYKGVKQIRKRTIVVGVLVSLLIMSYPVQDTYAEEKINELQFVVVDKPYVTAGDTQSVVVGISTDNISDAKLIYTNRTTGKTEEAKMTDMDSEGIRFDIPCTEDEQKGEYQVDAVTYISQGVSRSIQFTDLGMNVSYGVNVQIETEADSLVVEDDTFEDETIGDIAGITLLENSNTFSDIKYGSRKQNVVVVLDPGHDDKHIGASANGCREELLNFKIASYCKQELEKYSNVTVYMTRNSTACPYPGTTSGQCNLSRVNYATSVGANIYVSIHLNSASAASANGAEVYYPNQNYRPDIGNQGRDVAQSVLNELVSLGLRSRGIKIRNSEGDYYADGSVTDYYGVIRNGKKSGIPAIIIEHAFLTNSSDVNNFLLSEDGLRRLGVADATGIAKTFGLKYEAQMILDSNGIWRATINDQINYSYTGLARNQYGYWYFENGLINYNYVGFAEYGSKEWYILNGHVPEDFTGMILNQYGWWYVRGGELLRDYEGYATNEYGTWWFENGQVAWGKTGVVSDGQTVRYIENAQVNTSYNGMCYWKSKGWCVFVNGNYVPNYTGFATNEYGTWYVRNGQVATDYTDIVKDNNVWWYVENGRQSKAYTGYIVEGESYFYVENGLRSSQNLTGMYLIDNQWRYVENSQIQYHFYGMALNEYGWWAFLDGQLQWNFTGVGYNQYGAWWFQNGVIAWDYTGMVYDGTQWYYVNNGWIDLNYTGMALNEYGWWYFNNGQLDWTYTGMALNEYGWWYFNDGRLDWTYTGYGYNEFGCWWFENGRLVGAA